MEFWRAKTILAYPKPRRPVPEGNPSCARTAL